MDFENIKVIWDSQNDEPLYAMNEAAIQAIVQHRNRVFRRCTSLSYLAEIISGVVLGGAILMGAGILAVNPAFFGIRIPASGSDLFFLTASGGTWFYYAVYMTFARRRQLARSTDFDSTLRGDLDRAIAETNSEIQSMKRLLWHGLLPAWFGTYLGCITVYRLKGVSTTPFLMLAVVMIAALVAAIYMNRVVRNRLIPRQREMESLRNKLVRPGA